MTTEFSSTVEDMVLELVVGFDAKEFVEKYPAINIPIQFKNEEDVVVKISSTLARYNYKFNLTRSMGFVWLISNGKNLSRVVFNPDNKIVQVVDHQDRRK